MLDYSICPAASEHIPHLAANMREADRREIWAAHRQTPYEALAESLFFAVRAWTAVIDGRPALMWGVSHGGGSRKPKGIPWLLATDDLERKASLEFLRQSRDYVRRMQEGFGRLENFVHADNVISMRWLKWCGFSLADRPDQFNGENFYYFWRED